MINSKTINLDRLLLKFLIGSIIGFIISYFVHKTIDEYFNPFFEINYFNISYTNIAFGLLIGFISAALYKYRIFKVIDKSSREIVLAIITLVAILFIDINSAMESDKIFEYRSNYYLKNFEIKETNNKQEIGVNAIIDQLKSEIAKFGNNYTPLMSIEKEDKMVSINSNMPIVYRTFYDPGILYSWITRFHKVTKTIDDGEFNFVKSSKLAEVSKFVINGKIFLKIEFSLILDDNSKVGFSLDKLNFLFSKNSFQLRENLIPDYSESELKEGKMYFLINQYSKKNDFTTEYKTKSFKNDAPFGVSSIVYPYNKIIDVSYPQKINGPLNIEANIFQSNLLIKINGQVVYNDVYNRKNNEIPSFKDLLLTFSNYSSFSISNIKLNQINIGGRYEKRIDGKNYKYIPIVGTLNENAKIFNDENNNDLTIEIVPKNQIVNILYQEKENYKILDLENRKYGYCNKEGISNINLDLSITDTTSLK